MADIDLVIVNIRNGSTKTKICSKLNRKAYQSDINCVFMSNDVVLVSFLLILGIFPTVF